MVALVICAFSAILISVIVSAIIYSHSLKNGDVKTRTHWDEEYFLKHGCPFCGSHSCYEGPQGGASVNLMCAKCEAKFNFMGCMGIDLIEKPRNY